MAKIVESLKKLNVEKQIQENEVTWTMKQKCELSLSIEETVSPDQNYILGLCGTQCDTEFRIGAALSDYTCAVYTVGESINKAVTLSHAQTPIVGVKFSPSSKNILYTAMNNGLITTCDMRAKGKVVAEFKDNTEDGKVKPLASFDVSCNDRFIAGGTEHIGGDAFILFWDIRQSNSKTDGKSNCLGGYWESHMDDVTCLAFHSSKKDVLASGSTDGLINVFDLTKPSEDSALKYSLNTESSVDRLGWLKDDDIWCTTHMHSAQFWNCEDAIPHTTFERSNLVMSQADNVDNCYLVRYHSTNVFGEPFLLAGSTNIKENALRCIKVVNNRLERTHELVGNRQIVRDSWVHEKSGCLVTAGEGGIINVWRQVEKTVPRENGKHKLVAKIGTGKSRDKHHRPKPY